MDDTVKALLGFSQRIEKNLLPGTATIHDMIKGVFVFKALGSWHEESVDNSVS
jgi:hypothetical protein